MLSRLYPSPASLLSLDSKVAGPPFLLDFPKEGPIDPYWASYFIKPISFYAWCLLSRISPSTHWSSWLFRPKYRNVNLSHYISLCRDPIVCDTHEAIATHMQGKGRKECSWVQWGKDPCICMAGSLHSPPETITTWFVYQLYPSSKLKVF